MAYDGTLDRSLTVGASDIATLFTAELALEGEKPFLSPQELFNLKVFGQEPFISPEKLAIFEYGNAGEAAVLAMAGRRLGVTIEPHGETKADGDISSTPDGLFVLPDGTPAGVEAKITQPWLVKEEKPLKKHLLQASVGMMVWDRPCWYISYWRHPEPFIQWRVARVAKWEAEIRRRATEFMGYVRSRTAPDSWVRPAIALPFFDRGYKLTLGPEGDAIDNWVSVVDNEELKARLLRQYPGVKKLETGRHFISLWEVASKDPCPFCNKGGRGGYIGMKITEKKTPGYGE